MNSPSRSSSNCLSLTSGRRSTSPAKRRFGSVNTTQDEGTEPTPVPDPFKQFRSAFQPCSIRDEETDGTATRGATLDRFNQGMISCPELDQRATPSPSLPPRPAGSNPAFSRRGSYSQPPSPSSFRTRIALRFGRARLWSSPGASTCSPPTNTQAIPFRDGKARRRRAQETQPQDSPAPEEDPLSSSSPGMEGTNPLAMAGMLLATAELDRLSLMARRERKGKQPERTRGTPGAYV